MNKIIKGFFRITNSGKYIPEVDGIRFLAIISVIFFHAADFYKDKHNLLNKEPDTLNFIFLHGAFGVCLFFVLSGYILTLPFLKQFGEEKTKLKHVNLKDYYFRRLTRLEPPYIISLLLFSAMFIFYNHRYTFSYLFPHFIASFFYLSNFIYPNVKPIINSPAWTLEIEVQFYLVAPFLCYFIFYNKLSQLKRCIYLSVAIIILSLLQLFIKLPFESLWGYLNFFLAGILLAEILRKHQISPVLTKIKNPLALGILVLIICVDYYSTHVYAYTVLVAFIIILLYVLIIKYKALNFIFANNYICIIGGACYSIYLIHYPIISVIGRVMLRYNFSKNSDVNECIDILIYTFGILVISLFFYKLIERPCMDKNWPKKLILFFKNTHAVVENEGNDEGLTHVEA